MSNFLEIANKRRTQYMIGGEANHSIEEIAAELAKVVTASPSAFNSQTTRLVIVSEAANQKVWEIIDRTQKEILDEGMYNYFKGVFDTAKNAVGTVLFFEDRQTLEEKVTTTPERRELYKEQNAAIAEYAAWLHLAELGYGANLQHFNIGFQQGFDRSIKEALDLPDHWELNAQMPFGPVIEPAQDLEKLSHEEQVRIIKD